MDDVLALFGGRTKPVMAHLVESGRLSLEDVKEAEEAIRKLAKPKLSGKSSRKEGRS
jgi:BlaI family penicillinase repressor